MASTKPDNIEHLLRIAEAEYKDEKVEYTEAEEFAASWGITSGKARVPLMLIWAKYKEWRGNKRTTRPKFFAAMRALFKQVDGHIKCKRTKFMLLNEGIFDLSQSNIQKHRDATQARRKNLRRHRNRKDIKRGKETGRFEKVLKSSREKNSE